MAPFRWMDKLFFMVEVAGYCFFHRRDIHLLHVHESHWIAGFGAWLGQRLSVPVLCKESSYPALGASESDVPFAKSMERLRTSPRFIATTEAMADDLRRKGVTHSISVIPNGVEVPDTAADVAQQQDVLFVGNFTQGARWKAFDVLIAAWAKVHEAEPQAHLLIAGAGDPTPWATLARTLNCDTAVDFLGPVHEIGEVYRRAGLFVLPSRVEGLSNALLEAQSYGLPAVVSDIPGNTAVVTHGVNGFVVEPNNHEALAGSLLDLYRDGAKREVMGRKARERAIQRYAMPMITSQLLELYAITLKESA